MPAIEDAKVLIVATDGFEESELFGPRDMLMERGAEVRLASPDLAPIQATLVNLSKYTANGTLYYEDSKFSIRASGSWRDKFLLRVPSGRAGSDVQGNNSAFFVDATASYQLTPSVQLRLEAQNLTNQELGFYVDSRREDSLYSTYSGRKLSAGVAVKF